MRSVPAHAELTLAASPVVDTLTIGKPVVVELAALSAALTAPVCEEAVDTEGGAAVTKNPCSL